MRFPEEFSIADYFLFERLRDGLGEKTCVLFGDRSYTYQEVADKSRALACHLRAHGLKQEQRVYVVLPDAPPFVWSIFGTIAAGGVLAMGNPHAPVADLARALAYTRASALITTPDVANALLVSPPPSLENVYVSPALGTGEDPDAPVALSALPRTCSVHSLTDAIAAAEDAPLPVLHRDDPCVWLFTSGSTGNPKAAMHCHRDFAYNTEVYAKGTVGYRQEDICVSVPRLFFGYATGTNLWFPFAVGATVGLFPERPTPESLSSAIAKYRPTVVTNVPTMLSRLLDHDDAERAAGRPGPDLSSIRFHLSAGEALPPALLERFQERFPADIYDGIGSAEMFHIYCSNRPGDVKPGSLGRAVDGYELRLLPEDAAGPGASEVADGDIGVLWVSGDSAAQGYFQDRDKSFATFYGRWCRTGDLFRRDADGYYWFAGRADDLFKVGGIFVAPLEVEECLMKHPAVSLAAVVPEKRDDLLKPKAFIVLREEERARLSSDDKRDALTHELQEHVKNCLSKHKYPRWVEYMDDLPRNDRGKIDKKRLVSR